MNELAEVVAFIETIVNQRNRITSLERQNVKLQQRCQKQAARIVELEKPHRSTGEMQDNSVCEADAAGREQGPAKKLAALLRIYMNDRESPFILDHLSFYPDDMADWLAARGVAVLPEEPSEAAKEASRAADDQWYDLDQDAVDWGVDWAEYVLRAAYAAVRREQGGMDDD